MSKPFEYYPKPWHRGIRSEWDANSWRNWDNLTPEERASHERFLEEDAAKDTEEKLNSVGL